MNWLRLREKNQLTDLIRIEKINGKSNSRNIKDYSRLRTQQVGTNPKKSKG